MNNLEHAAKSQGSSRTGTHGKAVAVLFRRDAIAQRILATATCLSGWLAGWLAGCLSQPVLYQNN